MGISIVQADWQMETQGTDVLYLLNQYARDIVGGGNDLSDYVKENLIAKLSERSGVLVFLAYDDVLPIGLAICFEGFSTFSAKPLLNIHDFVVVESHRGQGIAKKILEKVEAVSISRGYCKITLEVLEGNVRAQKVYRDFGFDGYALDDVMGKALFWDKKLI